MPRRNHLTILQDFSFPLDLFFNSLWRMETEEKQKIPLFLLFLFLFLLYVLVTRTNGVLKEFNITKHSGIN